MAFSLVVLLYFAALAIDVAFARLLQAQLQYSVDAVAHAAILGLDGTPEGVARARAYADEMAARNPVRGQAIELQGGGSLPGELRLGVWDGQTFTPSDDPAVIDSVQVHAAAAEGRLGLAGAMGFDLGIAAQGVARQIPGTGASQVVCYLPLAIPSCLLEQAYNLDSIQDVTLVFNPRSQDNTGWAGPGGTPSAAWLTDQLSDCESSGAISIGTSIGLNNGELTSGLEFVAGAIGSSGTQWDPAVWGALPPRMQGSAVPPSAYGRTLEGAVMVFNDDTYCQSGGGSWSENQQVHGFVWGALYDVRAQGSSKSKTIRMRLDTSRGHEIGTAGGGPSYGITTPPTFALVR